MRNQTLHKPFFHLIFIFCICFSFYPNTEGANTQQEATRSINIDNKFSGINATTAFDITYTQNSSNPKAIIKGDKNLINDVAYEVDTYGTLKFYFKKDHKEIHSRISIILNGGALSYLESSNAGTLLITNVVTTPPTLNIKTSSAGTITFKNTVQGKGVINMEVSSGGTVECKELISASTINVSASSAGNVDLTRINVKVLNFSSVSGAEVKIENNNSITTNLSVNSAGEIIIKNCISEIINSEASSAGEINIKNCNAKTLNCQVSSTGTATYAGQVNSANLGAYSYASIYAKNLKIKQITSLKESSGGKVYK